MAKPRPLSPHLQVYRPQLTSVLSITHRASGVVLTTGTIILALWLISVASGPETFAVMASIVGHPLGQFVLFGYSVALFYHACNGIRHLSWDLGFGLTIPDVYRSGYVVLGTTCVLTALLWFSVWF
jgi:succinate dehydrogenase / fumarate reductase cytochrome b subunit